MDEVTNNPQNPPAEPERNWDVVVVGSGLAGLAAALEARLAGARVLVLEKMPNLGGNSVISDGWLNAPSCARQRAAGILDDGPELFLADMLKAGGGQNDLELARILAHEAGGLEIYLTELGVEFSEQMGYDGGHSRPRSLIPVKGGTGVYRPLQKRCLEAGVVIRPRHRADELLLNDSGRVYGLRVRENFTFDYHSENNDEDRSSGRDQTYLARLGVVMAGGGFGRDRRLWTGLDPRRPAENFESTNQPGATAGPLLMMLRAGALAVHLPHLQYGPWCSPDEKGFGRAPGLAIYLQQYGLAVDPATGRRFMDECADRASRAEALFSLKDDEGRPRYGILLAGRDLPERVADPDILERPLRTGVARRFDTLAELAAHYALPLAPLVEEIERFNRFVADGHDVDFGRDLTAGGGLVIKGPPFYALRMTAKAHFCQGGVKIDARARVLSAATLAPIPGLFAAGEAVGGTHGRSRLGNNAITEALIFGRLAGREVLATATDK